MTDHWDKLMQIAQRSEARMVRRIEDLEPALAEEVNKAIFNAQEFKRRYSTFPFPQDKTEVYAYPQGENTCWGVNGGVDGFCMARGTV